MCNRNEWAKQLCPQAALAPLQISCHLGVFLSLLYTCILSLLLTFALVQTCILPRMPRRGELQRTRVESNRDLKQIHATCFKDL